MSRTARDVAADAVALSKEHADRADAAEAALAELRETCEQHYRRAERLRKDYIALTDEVIAGLTTVEHGMDVVAGLPVCRCRWPLGGGDAQGAFITHALAVLAKERA